MRAALPVPEQGVPFAKDDSAYPEYLEIYGSIQKHYGSSKDLAADARAITELQKKFPSSPYGLFVQAEYKYALSGGQPSSFREVQFLVDQALRTNGANLPDGYILNAKMAAQTLDAQSALYNAEIAVRFAPDRAETQFVLGRAYQINKQIDKADAAYRKFLTLERDPTRKGNIYFWLGTMYSDVYLTRSEREKYRAKAAEALKTAAELNPNYVDLHTYASFLLAQMGDAAGARQYFNKLLQSNPQDGDLHYRLALVEYLNWARKASANGAAAALSEIEKSTGLSRQDAFVVAAGFDGLSVVTSAMIHANVIKDVNVVCPDNPVNLPGDSTALINAAFNDDLALVKDLVARRANINAQTSEGRTALIFAVSDQDATLASYLIEKGARVNMADSKGITPLWLAAKTSPASRQLVSLLLKHKANPMVVDARGLAVPVEAIREGNVDALDALITEGGVNVDTKLPLGTLIGYGSDKPAIVRYLLSKGASPWSTYNGVDLLENTKSLTGYQTTKAGKDDIAEVIAMLEAARKKQPRK